MVWFDCLLVIEVWGDLVLWLKFVLLRGLLLRIWLYFLFCWDLECEDEVLCLGVRDGVCVGFWFSWCGGMVWEGRGRWREVERVYFVLGENWCGVIGDFWYCGVGGVLWLNFRRWVWEVKGVWGRMLCY